MSIFNCNKCNFITENKRDYQRHINTQKHKKNIGELDNVKTIQKVSIRDPGGIQNIPQEDPVVYECDYCDATFKHTTNKYRHQKYRCKAKQRMDDKDKRIEELEKLLNEAMSKISNITNTTNNNNNTTNNNINNSRNINITINAYGQEDLTYIKDGDWLKMLTNPQDSVVKLFLETHFNPEHPENSNIRLRNRNSKFLEVHDGDNWKNKRKKKVLSEASDDKLDVLDSKFDTLQDTMSQRQRESHAAYHDDIYYDEKKDIVDEIEGVLLDNK